MESHEIVLSDRLARRSDSLTLREVLKSACEEGARSEHAFLSFF